MEDYLGDLLVIAVLAGVLLPIVITLLKRDWVFILKLVGVLALVASIPVAFMSELSLNGCCGAPPTGRTGWGYAIGVITALTGVGLIIISKKLAKNKKPGSNQASRLI